MGCTQPKPPVVSTEPVFEYRTIDTIRPNPLNPRTSIESDPEIEELAASIASVGLLQPVVITPAGLLIAGHRRLIACRRAGLSHVPVLIRDIDDATQLECMLVENLQRRTLNPVETARGCKGLRDRGHTIEQIALRTAISMEAVRRHLTLLTLPQILQERCIAGEMPLSYVLHLSRLPSSELQMRVALDAISERLPVEQLMRLVEKLIGPPPRKYPIADSEPRPVNHAARVIELVVELRAVLQRNPEVMRDLNVQQWLGGLVGVVKR